MAKARRKRAAPVYAANDPTPERLARDDFATIDAPRMYDEQVGRDALKTARKQVSRVRRMEIEGWVTRAEAAALERYEGMIEAAGYGLSRSCLDMTPRGGGGPEASIDVRAGAVRALAMTRNAVVGRNSAGQVPLIFVDAVLAPYGSETLTDVMDRLLIGPRADRREMARLYCGFVGSALVSILGG